MWSLRTSRGQRLAIARLPAVVGSAHGSDVRVPHDSVAAEHAHLAEGPDGALIVEAVADAIVGAGGKRVRRAALRDGDELILGRVRFTLVRAAPAGPATSASPGVAPRSRAGAARPPAPKAAERGGKDLLIPRNARTLPTRRDPGKRGLLHADLSQYTIGMRLLIAAALLVTCAGLVWAISLAFGWLG